MPVGRNGAPMMAVDVRHATMLLVTTSCSSSSRGASLPFLSTTEAFLCLRRTTGASYLLDQPPEILFFLEPPPELLCFIKPPVELLFFIDLPSNSRKIKHT
ncbi:hypothetical protein F2Q70_00005841 [Brassica cretica]|uniref:Uncharacterized protein n=1 Tax=Brassica cretica TaxID=69181 RepID=A0A8S9IP90_BRACR|nr:hypothetical protein F2Q70_00005841 [Brassica cretica]